MTTDPNPGDTSSIPEKWRPNREMRPGERGGNVMIKLKSRRPGFDLPL